MSLIPFQQALKGLGYDPGPVDGVWGVKTMAAVVSLIAARGAPHPRLATPAPGPSVGSPMIYQGSARYPVTEIVVHCSDTRPDWMDNRTFKERFAELRRWHMQDRGWKDIGYHWVIDRTGLVLPGRAESAIGAGVMGHNNGVIHVCLLGGHGSAETDRFADHFTADQDMSLVGMIERIRSFTRIARISGHNEWAAKACPGFNVPAWLKEKAL